MFWFRASTVKIAEVNKGHFCELSDVHPELEGRLNVSEDCRSLQITNLHQNDSDTYSVQIEVPIPRVSLLENFHLQVYKRLSESDLEVQCEKDHLSDGRQTWQLNCSAGMWEDHVKYNWGPASGTEVLFSRIYLIAQDNTSDDLNLTCTATNPVGSTSKTVSVKQTCEGVMDSPSGQPSYTLVGVTITALIVAKVAISACVSAKWPPSTK
ncbi:UNVERIFIED_CONTAM: hypothetical protein K2H54_013608 [Gekko kuhli]